MTSTEPTTEVSTRRPWWRRALTLLFLLVYRTVGTLTILIGLAALFSTTELFRTWFRDTAISYFKYAL